MIPKKGKYSPNEILLYSIIFLLPILSKLFQKISMKRVKPIIEQRKLIPNYYFGLRKKQSTTDQVYRFKM